MPQTFTTKPNAPTNLSLDASTLREITATWTDNSSGEDGYYVYRSTDGTNFTRIATLSANTTSYTDTSLLDGEKYYYYVSAYANDQENSSSTQTAITIFPRPTNLTLDSIDGDQFTVSWTDNSNNEDGFRIFVSTDGGATWTQDSSDLAPNTTSYTTSNLLDGAEYTIKCEVFTEHVTRVDAEVTNGTLTVSNTEFISTEHTIQI